MWLSNSSVGRKFVMALTGAFLVLFVTFHCLMNSIAIVWPVAYNSVCEFLGANWYALAASAVLAVFILIHIFYAVMLTVQNRRARGADRYAVVRKPKTVEWSSQNMFVLGIVILAFFVVHLIQFWAKMQLAEIAGTEGVIPPAAGTLFLQEAFSLIWTPIVYIIGFIAIWFHMNHGFWSMFQSIGWDNTVWIPRLKKISCWWSTIVILLFVAQAIVFTINAKNDFYKKNPALRDQYKEMLVPMIEKDFGPDAIQVTQAFKMMPFEQLSPAVKQQSEQMKQQLNDPQAKAYFESQPGGKEQFEKMQKQAEMWNKMAGFFNYLEEGDEASANVMPAQPNR